MTIAPAPVHRRPPRVAVFVVVAGVLGVAIGLLIRNADWQISFSTGHVTGSGVAVTESRHVPPFTGVELAGSNNVTVRIGRTQSVVVRGDDNLVQRVTTRVSAGTLVVGNKPGSFTTKAPMSVEVVVPSLDTLALSGSGNVAANGVRAEHLKVSLSGSGTLNASGSAQRSTSRSAGPASFSSGSLSSRDAHAVLTGSGQIVVHATDSLDGMVQGSGDIVYSGNPARVTKSVTGVGTIAGG